VTVGVDDDDNTVNNRVNSSAFVDVDFDVDDDDDVHVVATVVNKYCT